MAAVTFAISDPDTTALSAYAIDPFTPAADDLIVVITSWAGVDPTLITAAATDDQGGTYALIAEVSRQTNQHTVALLVRNQAAVAASTIITVTNTGDPSTGNNSHVYRVSGVAAYGASAVVHSGSQPDGASGATPAVTFGGAVDANNPTIAAVVSTGTIPTVTTPVGWTPGLEDQHTGPNNTVASVFRDSGFSGTTITWGSTANADYAAVAVEIAATAAETSTGIPWIRVA